MKIFLLLFTLVLHLTATEVFAAPVVVSDGNDEYLVADNGLVEDFGTGTTRELPIDTNEDHYSEIGFNGQDVGDVVPDSWNADRRWGNNGEETVATWKFEELGNGTYNVYASWRNVPQNNLSFAQYSMTDGGPTVELDQRIGTTAQSELLLNDGERDVDFALIGAVTISDGDLEVTADDSITDIDGTNRDFIHADAIAIGPLPNAVPGDFDGNGMLDAVDIDLLSAEVEAGTDKLTFDLNNDQAVNQQDREVWVNDLKNTWFGDANLDGEFNSGDFVQVFQVGEYEDGVDGNSGWADGDWNGDANFNSSDFIIAFQAGGFELGPKAAVASVPEPSAPVLAMIALCSVFFARRRCSWSRTQ